MTEAEYGPISGFVVSLLGEQLIGYIGIFGVIFYIGSYLALQLGLIKGEGYLYPSLNLIGSGSVLISLSTHFNPFSAFVETSWVTISVLGIVRHWYVMRYVRLSDEEQSVANVLVPRLKKDRAKKFLRLGRFVDAPTDAAIAVEGKPLDDLSMIVNGLCRIDRRGQTVALIRDGALVGELTYASGEPATASVIVAEPSRLFQINCRDLRAFLTKNADIASELESAITGDLRGKLAEATRRLSEQPGSAAR